nr:DUF3891 family protein [Pedobacter sp. ASV2]
MIVNYTTDGWEVITQRSHALLAAKICGEWKIRDRSSRWTELLIAVAEHDDIFNELERGPLINEKGGPVDFKMTKFNLEASRKLMDMAVTKSSFIALLTAKHISFTHGEESKASAFLATLNEQKKVWMKSAAINEVELGNAYELLEFCDAFSLLICQNLVPPEQRSLEISTGPGKRVYYFAEIQGELVVDPWPFEAESFELSYEYRLIGKLSFSSDRNFRNAFLKTAAQEKKVRFKKG